MLCKVQVKTCRSPSCTACQHIVPYLWLLKMHCLPQTISAALTSFACPLTDCFDYFCSTHGLSLQHPTWCVYLSTSAAPHLHEEATQHQWEVMEGFASSWISAITDDMYAVVFDTTDVQTALSQFLVGDGLSKIHGGLLGRGAHIFWHNTHGLFMYLSVP